MIEGHLLQNGYASVPPDGFDRERVIFPEAVLVFICETRPVEWSKLEALPGAQVLADLCRWMDPNGSLATLATGAR